MTRRALLPVGLVALALLAGSGPVLAQATDWRQIPKAPLRPFQPQQPRRLALPNGMVILLQEDHELPLVRGFARIRGGSRDEPADKAGLVGILDEAWRTGGTTQKTGDQLDDFLEARAARVETSGGLDSTSISFDCLKASFDEVWPVFLELLRDPAFREDKIALAKNQANTGIARRNDDAGGIAAREARRLGYGADSPYARNTEYATVAAVTRDDLLAWHKRYVHPNNIVMGVVGDFQTAQMEATLKKAFAAWPKGPAAAKVPAQFAGPKPGVYFVAKDDVNQSNIRMVHLGTTRDNPDYYALEVMNEVFGGGFSGRLLSNIRSKKGLAYGVGGGVGSNFDYPGLFSLAMGTKSESTAAAIDALYEEIDKLQTSPATAEELRRAKDTILNSFVFRFDSKSKVLNEKLLYEFYGYPSDFLERYRAAIDKVTAEDVSRVARKYVHKDQIALLVVGKAADFDRPLSSFGPVTALDIHIPEGTAPRRAAGPAGSSRSAAAGADAASAASGKTALARVVEGLGGAAKVQAVKSFRQKSKAHIKTLQGEFDVEIDSLTVFPDRQRQNVQAPMGSMTLVVAPDVSFMSAPGVGVRDMPASQKESALKDVKTHPIYVAQHLDDPKTVVRAVGKEKVGDLEAQVLELNVDGAEAKWWVDPQTGRILKTSARVSGMGPPADQVIEYSDFRTIGGMPIPFKQKLTRDGQDAGSVELQEFEVNPTIDPTTFEKPKA
jgi:zinc protease